jgi:hypothetical protein
MAHLPPLEQSLKDWFDAEFDRRTQAVEAGDLSPKDLVWLSPDYRVQFSELSAKAEELGLRISPVDLAAWANLHCQR